MVVDSQVIAVGSHNWSGNGVLRNRDATVVIYNKEAAHYGQQIFVHDWTKMAERRRMTAMRCIGYLTAGLATTLA
jgi:phosphatidylserine/phosphatidylglycerophosphate/cardiolipin synthase-like enzyme